MEWKDNGANQLLKGEDKRFYISYNPKLGMGIRIFEADNSADETALCITASTKPYFLILNGDFRKEYEAVINKGLGACLQVFLKHEKEHGSTWSTKTPIHEWLEKRFSKMGDE